ncbi:hypothetical protein QA596_04905 [Balneolales bacterium ANBcel1]|nr:hypothetical protein [Balneolales bacterium ANBcel1]
MTRTVFVILLLTVVTATGSAAGTESGSATEVGKEVPDADAGMVVSGLGDSFIHFIYPHMMTYIRDTFYDAVESRAVTQRLTDFFENQLDQEVLSTYPVILAYHGATKTLLAKHGRNPFARLSNLRSGLQTLDEATDRSPGEFEIRFLRFSVLHHLPSFLGYGDQLDEDTQAVFELLVNQEQFQHMDVQMACNLMEFIIESGRLDDSQQKEMIQLHEKLKAHESLSSD